MEIKTGRQVIDIEIKALNLLKSYISKDFVKVVNLLLKNIMRHCTLFIVKSRVYLAHIF